MEDVRGGRECEVVEELAVAGYGLGSDAGWARFDVGGLEGRDVGGAGLDEGSLAGGEVHFRDARSPEAAGHAPGARPGQRREEVEAGEGAEGVGRSGRGEQGGGAEPDVAGDRLGEVDAEEREGRVRDRVDQGLARDIGRRA